MKNLMQYLTVKNILKIIGALAVAAVTILSTIGVDPKMACTIANFTVEGDSKVVGCEVKTELKEATPATETTAAAPAETATTTVTP